MQTQELIKCKSIKTNVLSDSVRDNIPKESTVNYQANASHAPGHRPQKIIKRENSWCKPGFLNFTLDTSHKVGGRGQDVARHPRSQSGTLSWRQARLCLSVSILASVRYKYSFRIRITLASKKLNLQSGKGSRNPRVTLALRGNRDTMRIHRVGVMAKVRLMSRVTQLQVCGPCKRNRGVTRTSYSPRSAANTLLEKSGERSEGWRGREAPVSFPLRCN